MAKLTIDGRMIEHSGIGRYLQNIIPGLIQSDLFDITILGTLNKIKKEQSISDFALFEVTEH